jgi:prefoldin subunit 4
VLQVRKEDQLLINEFGRNNAALYEIREQKKALKDKLDTLDDANTDLMMGEGDNVQCVLRAIVLPSDLIRWILTWCACRLFIGESFVEASEDFAQEYLEKRVEVRRWTAILVEKLMC